jgi:hypothetical protein
MEMWAFPATNPSRTNLAFETDSSDIKVFRCEAKESHPSYSEERRFGHDNHRRLCRVYGWPEKKTKASWGGTTVDYKSIAEKAVHEMKKHDIEHFVVFCALVSDLYCPGYNPQQSLAKDSKLILPCSYSPRFICFESLTVRSFAQNDPICRVLCTMCAPNLIFGCPQFSMSQVMPLASRDAELGSRHPDAGGLPAYLSFVSENLSFNC